MKRNRLAPRQADSVALAADHPAHRLAVEPARGQDLGAVYGDSEEAGGERDDGGWTSEYGIDREVDLALRALSALLGFGAASG